MFKSVLDMNFWDICSTRPSPINSDITEAGFDVITTLSLLHTHIYGVYYTHANTTPMGIPNRTELNVVLNL